MVQSARGTAYAKIFSAQTSGARTEWHWLHMLPMLGVRAPDPIASRFTSRRAMIVTAAVSGRSLDAWLVDARREGWLAQAFAYVCQDVADMVARLHRQGVVHRDLNTAHLFVADPRLPDSPPTLIDVERMFEPRWRRRRWIVKDLASLLASSPVPVTTRVWWRFLRGYAPELGQRERRRLAFAVRRKAKRIAAHQPRYG
ncbi:MAG: lipopolysaccharide kinase InaA family protein [Planctomycetota bacterium]